MKGKLRPIADPFVVAAPSGTHARTRLRPTVFEETVISEVGGVLGSLLRKDVAGLCADPTGVKNRKERKQLLTASTSSRWAGSITAAAQKQYGFSLDALFRERDMLRAASGAITKRLKQPVGVEPEKNGKKTVRGYRDASEWFQKKRRLVALEARLVDVEKRCTERKPRVVVGGKVLLRKRSNLEDANLTAGEWRGKWDTKRSFLTAVGESGKTGGNETIRVSEDGTVTIKLPTVLAVKHGMTHLVLENKISFETHRGVEWLTRVEVNKSLTYTVTKDPAKNRTYLDVSWGLAETLTPTVEQLGSQRRIGVDLNADHIAAHVVDRYGNPTGEAITIPLHLTGIPATTRDAHLRHAISTLINYALEHNITVVAIENLNFTDARDTGRETMGRAKRGKTFRTTVAGIPTAQFRDRLAAMAATLGLWIIAVDPAYTFKWGAQHWGAKTQTSTETPRTRHHAAAVAIGRRSNKQPIRRRKPRPRVRQRTNTGFQGLTTRCRPTSTTRTVTPPPRLERGRSRDTSGHDPTPFGVNEQDSLLLTI